MMIRRRRRRVTEKQLAAELYAHRDDPDEWGEESIPAQISAKRAAVTSLRLPMTEFIALQKAAKRSGETVSEFIRTAISLRLNPKSTLSAVEITTGASEGSSHGTFLAPALEAGRTQNPGPDWTGRIPQYANITR